MSLSRKYKQGWNDGYEAGKSVGLAEARPRYIPPRQPDGYIALQLEYSRQAVARGNKQLDELRRENQFLQDRIDQLIACGVSR